jgi:hypothetical protein
MELKRVDPNFLPNSAFDCPTCCQQSIQNVWSSYFSNNWANWAYYFAFHELRYPQAPNMKDEWMRVISKTRLRRFWESPGNTDSQRPLRAWQYDEDKWKEDCGCYEPPVQKPKKRGK